MRSVYVLQLEITPNDSESTALCLGRLRDTFSSWVADRLQHKWGAPAQTIMYDGVARTPLPDHALKATHDREDGAELIELTWSHPHDSGSKWVTHCTMACANGGVAFALHLRLESNHFDLRPLSFQLGRPKVVDTIVNSFRCTISGVPVSAKARIIDDDDVDSLVSDVLLMPTRRIPVIAVSVDCFGGHPLVNPDEIQGAVLGFASVICMKDKWAAFRLTDAIGKPLSCYDGAVRLYWPGVTLASDPYDHPLFLAGRLTEPGRPIAKELFRWLNSIASFRFREVAAIMQARAAINEKREGELESTRKLLAAGSLNSSQLESALEKSWDEEKRLRAELAARNAEINDLSFQLDTQQQIMASMRQEMADAGRPAVQIESKATEGFANVAAAIAAAKRDFCGPGKALVLLESAIDAAGESPYKQPDKVYELCRALSEIGERWKKGKGALGKDGWRGALEHEGFIYKPRISQTTKNMYSNDYTFTYNGEKELFEEHVTVGGGDPNTCASIHWILDEDNRLVVVGHCGRHLPNTST